MTGLAAFVAGSTFACVTATVGVSLLGVRNRLDQALAWALLASTTVIGTLLIAGELFDDLSRGLVVAITFALALAFVLIWLGLGHRPRPVSLHTSELRRVLASVRRDRWLLALLVVAALELLWRVAIAYLMPPYAADALWYHLTAVADWVQSGHIGPDPLSIWATVYPHNGELLMTWPALLLRNDTLVDAVQLPFAIVAALAVAGIARSAGVSRRGAAAAACIFLLTPIVLSQTTASYVDVLFIAFFLVAFHFVLRVVLAPSPDWRFVFLAGLASGLALGTKSLGLAYVGVLSLVLLAYLVARAFQRRVGVGAVATSLLLFATPLLALGSYHYIEIWARYGNPIYPIRVSALGITLFKGFTLDNFLSEPPVHGPWWKQVWAQWHRDHWFLTHPRFHAYSYDGRPSGLGPFWSYVGFLAVIAFAVWAARRNRAILFALVLPVVAMYALQPYKWWSRFTMILVALGAVAVAALVERAPRRASIALKAVTAATLALGVAFPTLKIDGEFWASRIVRLVPRASGERTIGRVALPAYRWLDEAPADATVGVDLSTDQFGGAPYILPYPLFGRHFRHHVIRLPIRSEQAFAQAIAAHRVAYLFVRRGRRLDRWAEKLVRAGCAERISAGRIYTNPVRAYEVSAVCISGAASGAAAPTPTAAALQ